MKFLLIDNNLNDQDRLDVLFQRVLQVTSKEKSVFWLRSTAFESLPNEAILNRVLPSDVAGMKFVYTEDGIKKSLTKLSIEIAWADENELQHVRAVFLELPSKPFDEDLLDEFVAMLLQIEQILQDTDKAAYVVMIADEGMINMSYLERAQEWLNDDIQIERL